MLRRTIARYETITENDVAWTETAIRRVSRSALTDPAALIGMAARRRLNHGRAIMARDIQISFAIRNGDLVAIVYTTPFMTLTARGSALQDAAAGAPIRNILSGQLKLTRSHQELSPHDRLAAKNSRR
jgi:flagella basal body P-ring formation protein FlgA